MRASLFLTCLALSLGALACDDDPSSPSNQERFTATLTGGAERPTPVTTNATGSATVTLNTSTKTFTYTLSASNITGVTAAHIHGPATTDQPAGVLVPLTAPTSGSVSGSFGAADISVATVSVDSLIALLRSGRTYVNVHTSANLGGEIRGQLTPD